MCGICGYVNLNSGPRVDPADLWRMTSSVRHRGPDASGFYSDDLAGLGHARLSIIDLAGGAQPMSNQDKSLWITFNGEIFNYIELREELVRKGHTFSTRSDTEVLLHLYQEEGEDCTRRLNGQWAFAIWDVKRRKLFLSRDRFGIRPLFYTQAAGTFWFASEIKALFTVPAIPRELDLDALNEIFTFWVTLPPRTAFKGIGQLPPGHSMVVEDGNVRVFRYWNLEYTADASAAGRSEADLADELRALLLDATRIRLRADVPVGAYLSGGLDSTLITALTRTIMGDGLETFSVGFEAAEYDESAYQKEASAFWGTRHHEVRCSDQDIADIFPDVVWHAEQPILRTAPAPLFVLSRLVRSHGFKVVLTGEGADELFGGYDIFKEAKIRRFCARSPESPSRLLLLKRLYPYMNGIQRQPAAYLARFFQTEAADLSNPFFSHLPRWNLTARLKTLFSDEARSAIDPGRPLADLEQSLPDAFATWDPFHQAEHLEATHLLPGYILSSQGDRMAMAHSVEGRYPFLDYRVAAFAAALPPRLKMKVLDQKHLLKRSAAGLIPESIRKRPKQPYRAPATASLLATDGGYPSELLSASNIRRDGVFDPSAVAALAGKFRTARVPSERDTMALVGVLSTEILLDRFVRTGHRAAAGQACSACSAGQNLSLE